MAGDPGQSASSVVPIVPVADELEESAPNSAPTSQEVAMAVAESLPSASQEVAPTSAPTSQEVAPPSQEVAPPSAQQRTFAPNLSWQQECE